VLAVRGADVGVAELLGFAECVIAVSSTVVYQALDCGCKCFILEMGDRYFDDLIKQGVCRKLSYSEGLSSETLKCFTPSLVPAPFFESFNSTVLQV